MKAVELFAGIGGFRIAADRLGFDTLWANDICPMASTVYRSQFGQREFHEGDITELAASIPAHDLLTGGFPCQPFSSAGKKQGIQDPRGTLFEHIVETVARHNPRFFVLENVKRLLTMESGRHFATILASLAELDYMIEWRLLNAIDFGLAQNRQRVIIVGVRQSSASSRNEDISVRLAVPEELGQESRGKFLLSASACDWPDIGSHGARFPNWGLARKGCFTGCDPHRFLSATPSVLLQSVLESDTASEFDFTESTLARLQNSVEVNRFVGGVEILSNQGGGARMGYTIFGINGIAPTLTATPSRHYERYKIGDRYRRLTNVEYARLQGFPDDHCSSVSLYNQYGLYGNAVPPSMVEWVMRRLTSPGVPLRRMANRRRQKELFFDV